MQTSTRKYRTMTAMSLPVSEYPRFNPGPVAVVDTASVVDDVVSASASTPATVASRTSGNSTSTRGVSDCSLATPGKPLASSDHILVVVVGLVVDLVVGLLVKSGHSGEQG